MVVMWRLRCVRCRAVGPVSRVCHGSRKLIMDNPSKAAQLKEAGNKLFLQQDYARAAVQYSEAITLDPRNAILYANRAACHLALRESVLVRISGLLIE
jgi:hypothetical protein